MPEIHGSKEVKEVWWDSEQGVCIKSSDKVTLSLVTFFYGDHDEDWIIQKENGVETARHNSRHVESIIFAI